ncbi:MAG: glycosyltransferase family 39 protein [Acidobacteria bacterium]|nr:glycosyltransferase family 39 protein [Acidobacteriota bacterium]
MSPAAGSLLRKRGWLACVLVLVALQAARLFQAARTETQTWDEGLHLASGYMFLVTGEYRLDVEHPPLGRILNALPLVGLSLDPHLTGKAWADGDAVEQGRALLYAQPSHAAEEILLRARLVTVGLTALLSLVMAFWMRTRFGEPAALLSVFLTTLDPNLSAHGHYVTTDFIAAATAFLTVIAFDGFIRRRTWPSTLMVGLALGVALSSKFSTLFLLPALLLVWLLSRPDWKAMPLQAAVMLLVASAIVAEHQQFGHPAYMLGQVYRNGRWEYFPFVFLVKSPLGALLLALLAAGVLWRAWRREWLVLALPLLVYWGLSITSGINIGVRHLLPVYPLMYALIGAMLWVNGRALYGKALPPLVGVACGLVLLETARIAPRDIAFFNLAAGGPENGPKLLGDSNLDWGQDLGALRQWAASRGISSMCVHYFGTADKGYYGFPDGAAKDGSCRYVAASMTLLQGVYPGEGSYDWLRARTPIARVGWSINIYDMGGTDGATSPRPERQ